MNYTPIYIIQQIIITTIWQQEKNTTNWGLITQTWWVNVAEIQYFCIFEDDSLIIMLVYDFVWMGLECTDKQMYEQTWMKLWEHRSLLQKRMTEKKCFQLRKGLTVNTCMNCSWKHNMCVSCENVWDEQDDVLMKSEWMNVCIKDDVHLEKHCCR